MDQVATFKDELNLIEAESQGMDEEVKLWIKTTNLNKDLVQKLGIFERASLQIKFGHGLFEGRARALRKRARGYLINRVTRR